MVILKENKDLERDLQIFVALQVKETFPFFLYVCFPESESQVFVGLMSPTSLMTHTSANAEVSTILLLICSCLQTEV